MRFWFLNVFPTYLNCATFQSIVPAYTAYEDGTDSVPKRRDIKFGRQGITQKKEY